MAGAAGRSKAPDMDAVLEKLFGLIGGRADLGHLALTLSVAVTLWHNRYLQRELTAASERFDDFVRELASFNRRHGG